MQDLSTAVLNLTVPLTYMHHCCSSCPKSASFIMADGPAQYIQTLYISDKPILEGPKSEKILIRGAQIRKFRVEGPKFGTNIKRGPKSG